jgi:hypothetical protein
MQMGRICFSVWAALKERGQRRRVSRQAGFSATELLVFTAPLCILSMVLASKLAATSSAHIRAGWQSSLAAQQAAKQPCGGNPKLNAPFHPEADPGVMNAIGSYVTWGGEVAGYTVMSDVADVLASQRRMSQGIGPLTQTQARAAQIRSGVSMGIAVANTVITLLFTALTAMSTIPEDVMTSPDLVQSNWATRSTSAPVERYHFQRAADAVVSGPSSVSASATFVCNEPDDGDSVRDERHEQLIGQATIEANGIYF